MKARPSEVFKLRERGIAFGKEVKVVKLSDLKSKVEWLLKRARTVEGECVVNVDYVKEAFEDVMKGTEIGGQK